MKSIYYEQIDYLDHDLMRYVEWRRTWRLGVKLLLLTLVTGILCFGSIILTNWVTKNATNTKTTPYVSQRPGGK